MGFGKMTNSWITREMEIYDIFSFFFCSFLIKSNSHYESDIKL